MTSIRYSLCALVLSVAVCGTVSAYDGFDGVGLFTYQWTQSTLQNNEGVWLSDFNTGTITKLWGKGGAGGVNAAAFSPDGKQIIFNHSGKLHIMDNNGSRHRILPLSGPCNPDYSLCWTTGGIFWVGGNGGVWRYVIETNSLSRLHKWDDLIAGNTKGYWSSMDGRKGWCWAELDDGTPEDTHGDQPFLTFNADWSLRSELRVPIWGHGNYMSHSGNLLLFGMWGGGDDNNHRRVRVVRHEDAVEIGTIHTGLPPGVMFGVFNTLQPCVNDSQLILMSTNPLISEREGSYVGDFWVWNWVTLETPKRVAEPYKADGKMMWKGPLPEVVLTEPWLSSDRNEYVYWNQWNHTESIPITNTGGGTLGPITVDTVGGNWLNYSVVTSNDTQYVRISLRWAAIPIDSTYKLVLRISGGGAENVLDIPIYKVHGNLPMIPEPVNAYPAGATGTDVLCTWTDRSNNESGFELQRRSESGVWTDVTTTAADVRSYTDITPGYGTWYYRVRAISANGHSAYTDSVEVLISGVPTITVVAPSEGQQLQAGDSVYIEWTAHLISQVQIKYTVDGEEWTEITSTGGVMEGNPDWGYYRWIVPDISAPQVRLHIHKYGTPQEGGYSGMFSIGATAAPYRPDMALPAILRHAPVFMHQGHGHVFDCSLAPKERAVLRILRLDGSLVARLIIGGAANGSTWQWDGRDLSGRPAGKGILVARLSAE